MGRDAWYLQVQDALAKGKTSFFEGYSIDENGFLRFIRRMYIPNVEELRRLIMDEAH